MIDGGVKVSRKISIFLQINYSYITQASRKVCGAVKSGVRIAESTAGPNFPGIKIVTGEMKIN